VISHTVYISLLSVPLGGGLTDSNATTGWCFSNEVRHYPSKRRPSWCDARYYNCPLLITYKAAPHSARNYTASECLGFLQFPLAQNYTRPTKLSPMSFNLIHVRIQRRVKNFSTKEYLQLFLVTCSLWTVCKVWKQRCATQGNCKDDNDNALNIIYNESETKSVVVFSSWLYYFKTYITLFYCFLFSKTLLSDILYLCI